MEDAASSDHRRCGFHRLPRRRPSSGGGLSGAGFGQRRLAGARTRSQGPPAYLSPEVEYVRGDVRDGAALERALRGVDAVLHLAAMVGVGQSMYEVERYTAVNDLGTATLMQALLERPVGRLVVASSMSVYGEGRYLTAAGEVCDYAERDAVRIRAGDWDPTDRAGGPLRADRDARGKAAVAPLGLCPQQVRPGAMSLLIGEAYGIPTIALRFFNVYGTAPGAVESVHRGARHLRRAPPERQPPAGIRGRCPAPRLRPRQRRRPRLPTGAGGAEEVRGVFNIGSGESRTICEVALPAGVDHGPARAGAGDHRALPHRRRAALLRGHRAGARGARVRAAGGVRGGTSRSWWRGSRTPPRSTGSMRRPRSWRGGGWWHERRDAQTTSRRRHAADLACGARGAAPPIHGADHRRQRLRRRQPRRSSGGRAASAC